MINFILFGLLLYLSFGAVLYLLQRDFIYVPSRQAVDLAHAGAVPVNVTTDDGLTIEGWYVAPAPGRKVAVFFHGNTGNAGHRDFMAAPFVMQGLGFLFAEYRGYGRNPGKPGEEGLYSDARAYISWLVGEGGIAHDRIILMGESIGTGPAVKMATEFPEAAALILLSPYTSLTTVAQKHYPLYPAALMLRDRYDSLSRMAEIEMPLLIIHGRKDMIIPFSHAQSLKAANDNVRLAAIEEAGHNNLYQHNAAGIIAEFVENLN